MILLRHFAFIAIAISAPSLLQAEQDLRQIFLEAQRSSLAKIKSGAVSGTFNCYTQTGNEKEWKQLIQAELDAKFLERKFYLRLVYAKSTDGQSKAITIHDNKQLTTSRFSAMIHPAMAEGYIFEPQAKTTDTNVSPFGGFPWDISKLSFLDLDQFLKKYDATQLKLQLNADGDITGEITTDTRSRTLLFPKDAGFNLTEFQEIDPKTKKPRVELQAKWKKIDDVWVLMSCSQTRYLPDVAERNEVVLTKYDLNCPVEEKTFAFSNLELPITARMVDHRPNALIRTWLQYPPMKKISTKGETPPLVSKKTPE